jgi:hypothetical protein
MLHHTVLCSTLLFAAEPTPDRGRYFQITVVDDQTGRGVPLVELRTVNDVRLYTDSNGIVAFDEPGLMDQTVFFHVKGHGYEYPKDGFGFRGKALRVSAGGGARLEVKRTNIAERLYRVTGGGIYRDSLLVGRPAPIRQPVLNAQVFGSDSVVDTLYQGKIYWFWGDTNRPAYPLGNFHVPGATSELPGQGGLDPALGVDLDYFRDEQGFAKPTARMPGEGPTWISGLVTLPDATGRERMFATYVKVRGFLDIYERGLVRFNDQARQFDKVAQFALHGPIVLDGHHPFRHVEDGVEYIYCADPYPLVRFRARADDLEQPARWEAYTCLEQGTRLEQERLDRGGDGTVRYGWKVNTPPVRPAEQAKLIQAGRLKPVDALLHLQDADTGRPVSAHRGSVYWNAYRGRWVMVTCEQGGASFLGETWYAEGDTPLGPWVYARKVVTHDRYSFYNPKQHPLFDKDGGRVIFFEGTYTNLFSGNPDQTPRYDYNQVMYKLDLADPRLVLAVPVYDLSEGAEPPGAFGTRSRWKAGMRARRIAFFAPDRPGQGTVPVCERTGDGDSRILQVGDPPRSADGDKPAPVFHALPAEIKAPPPTTVPLYEFRHEDGARRAYSTDRSWSRPGFRRSERPLCLVWRNPMRARAAGE